MASVVKKYTKAGQPFYEIRCHMGRGMPTPTKRWYPPKGWSEKSIQRELTKQASFFEEQCRNGEVVTRAEKAQIEVEQAAEQERIETLRQYTDRVYLPSICNYSPHTKSNYYGNLKKWIYPALGDVRMPEISGAMITSLLFDMQAEGKAYGTILRVKNILSSICKMAYFNDLIEKNPMDKVIMPKESKEEKKDGVEAYTEEQVNQIFEALSLEPLHWQVFVRLLLETGLRRGEACGLHWSDVNFETGEITVSGALNYTPEAGVYYSKPKNGHVRFVFIGQNLISLLKHFRKNQKVVGQYIFTEENGQPMFPDVPTRYFKRFSDRYNIPNFHPHILRHTFASLAVTNGADIASLSALLGHSDMAVTLRMYTHANKESIQKVGCIVQAIFEK